MFDPLKDQLELQAIRRKLNELRREFDKLSGEVAHGPMSEAIAADRGLLELEEATLIARRHALDEIEREAELLEERIAELEDRYGVNATFN